MKKLIMTIVAISLTASCSILRSVQPEKVKAEKNTAEKNKPAPVEIKKPSAGDLVVARWGPGVWAEGSLESIDREQAKIDWRDESSPSEVAVSDVFALPKAGAEINLKPGDYTLVKGSSGRWWQGAEIREVRENMVKAKIIDGGEIVNLPPEKVLVVTDAVAADIKDAAAREDFLDKAHEHRPAAVARYRPKAGDRILGEWAPTPGMGDA